MNEGGGEGVGGGMRGSGLDAGVDKKAVGDRVWIYRAGKKRRASATVYLGLRTGIIRNQESRAQSRKPRRSAKGRAEAAPGAAAKAWMEGEAGLRCPFSDEGAQEYSTRTDES